MKLTDLLQTSIVGYVQTEAEIYDETDQEIRKITLWEPENNPTANMYLHRTMSVYFNFEDTFAELILSLDLIEKSDVQSIYIRYIMKNWISRFITIYEMSFVIINEIFNLGYTGKTVTKNNIELNRHVIDDSKIQDILSRLRKLINRKISGTSKCQIVSLNNKIKHLGDFENDLLSNLSSIELFKSWGEYEDTIKYNVDYGNNITIIHKDLKELTSEMLDILNDMILYLDSVFNTNFLKMKENDKLNFKLK